MNLTQFQINMFSCKKMNHILEEIKKGVFLQSEKNSQE
jgi:hypothetical protein